ncbi:MAG TPA: selenide, water dikinase SelD, partial [Mycobacterium sp.]|nr:selenide, water dikinase SelD [Mycobacterium sp.]
GDADIAGRCFAPAWPQARLVCGLEWGDDATVVDLGTGLSLVTTTDFFPPVVDDPYCWGRIAAANALSDVYAMGATPVSALNLLAWPTDEVEDSVAVEVLRGGSSATDEAGCFLAGGHSIQDATPKYGLAVTGVVETEHLMRNDAARPGDPMSITKPLGLGVLNNRHKQTAMPIDEAIAVMSALNKEASRAAVAARITAATDITGFGLLGHLYKMARASGVSAVVDAASVPILEGAVAAVEAGCVPGGTIRNLEWVQPHLQSSVSETQLILLADAQTSGGLLLAGEIPGATVIGHFEEPSGAALIVR